MFSIESQLLSIKISSASLKVVSRAFIFSSKSKAGLVICFKEDFKGFMTFWDWFVFGLVLRSWSLIIECPIDCLHFGFVVIGFMIFDFWCKDS